MIAFLILMFCVVLPLLFLVDFIMRNRGGSVSLLIDNADLIQAIRSDEGIQTIDNALLIQIMREERGGFLQ